MTSTTDKILAMVDRYARDYPDMMPDATAARDAIEDALTELAPEPTTSVKRCPTASVIVFNRNGHVLLVYNRDFNCWVYPGGHVEPDEWPHQGGPREVKEEAGVTVDLGEPVRNAAGTTAYPVPFHVYGMTIIYPDGEVHDHLDHLYVGLAADDEPLVAQDAEVADVRWFPTDQLPADARPDVHALTAPALNEVFPVSF